MSTASALGHSSRAELRGVAVSSGIAIGPAYVVERRLANVVRQSIAREDVDGEVYVISLFSGLIAKLVAT